MRIFSYTNFSYYNDCYYYDEWVRYFNYCFKNFASDCLQALGYYEDYGICENEVLTIFLVYSFIDRNGNAGFDLELITSTIGCWYNEYMNSRTRYVKDGINTADGYEICEIP